MILMHSADQRPLTMDINSISLLLIVGVQLGISYPLLRGQKARWSDLARCAVLPTIPIAALLWLSSQKFPSPVSEWLINQAIFSTLFAMCWGTSIIDRISRNSDQSQWGQCLFALLFLAGGIVFLTQNTGHSPEVNRRRQCRENLKAIGLAMHTYLDTHSTFPAAISGDGPLAVSWRVSIEPYIDAHRLERRYDDHFAWNAEPNWPFTRRSMPLYECPTARKQRTIAEDDFGLTDYAALVGEEAAFPLERGIKARDFADGTSNTLMVVEAVDTGIRWAEPKDIYVPFANMTIRSQETHQDQLNPLISSTHTGGGHVLMADGTVRFISSSVSPEILQQLTTRAAGDVVSDDF
ncbi:MAG: hypothetical protein C0478_05865 [Planctomyces sp.]|nr:hypothetical protein [Planctomyces sp.]